MGRVHPAQQSRPPPPVDEHDGEQPDVHALIEENTRLKQLVLQLSRLVFRTVVDRK